MWGDCLHSKSRCFFKCSWLLFAVEILCRKQLSVCLCVCTWAYLSHCITTHRSIRILFLAIRSWKKGIACLSHSSLAIPPLSLLFLVYWPVLSTGSPAKLFLYFPSFPPPDNTKGTLSSSQVDAEARGRVSGEQPIRGSFGGPQKWLALCLQGWDISSENTNTDMYRTCVHISARLLFVL